jgi:hypothetical protein
MSSALSDSNLYCGSGFARIRSIVLGLDLDPDPIYYCGLLGFQKLTLWYFLQIRPHTVRKNAANTNTSDLKLIQWAGSGSEPGSITAKTLLDP